MMHFCVQMSFLIGQGAAAFGYHMALSGPTADFVRDTLAISDALKDFCFSLVCVGAIVGSFAAGWLADKVGRRRALMATLLPFTAGTLLMAFNLSVFGPLVLILASTFSQLSRLIQWFLCRFGCWPLAQRRRRGLCFSSGSDVHI
jgi:MFS family permease